MQTFFLQSFLQMLYGNCSIFYSLFDVFFRCVLCFLCALCDLCGEFFFDLD